MYIPVQFSATETVYVLGFRVQSGTLGYGNRLRGGSETFKREFKLPWREAGPPNHLNDQVDSDQ